MNRTHIDFLSLILHDDGESMVWLDDVFDLFQDVGSLDFENKKFGKNHYEHGGVLLLNGAAFAELNWGGQRQRETVQVILKGQGCSYVPDWKPVVARMNDLAKCKISRVDVAYDSYDGSLTLEQVWAARADRKSWVRGKGGRPPKIWPIGPMDERTPDGRSVYIGNRDSDLVTRVYEKGLQLFKGLARHEGIDPLTDLVQLDAEQPPFIPGNYVRFECEFKPRTTILPNSVLLDTDALFAGAYPYAEKLLKHEQPYIRLRQDHVVMTDLDSILNQISLQYGPSINSACLALGPDRVMQRIMGARPNENLKAKGLANADPAKTPRIVKEPQ
jgi:DNA relaxase NicK